VAILTIPILHKAPDWEPDLSEYVILWHGCTAVDKNGIEMHGIDLTRCAVDTDFGRGFYTTTLERQARLWAWDRYFQWAAKNPTVTGNQPVVLRFRVRRYSRPKKKSKPKKKESLLDKGLDELLSLQFVRDDYDNEDFWSMVQHCRQSVPAAPTKRQLEVVHDHKRPPGGWYQMVSRPVNSASTKAARIYSMP
jgi:hypothetical protein